MLIAEDLIVRRATIKDAVTLAAYNIHMALETENKRLDPYVVSAGVRNALEDERKGIYLVADLNGRVIGQLLITREWSDWRNGDIWWIQSVYVHPEFRKQGVFTRLHEQAERDANEEGAVGASALRRSDERDRIGNLCVARASSDALFGSRKITLS